MSDFSGGPIPNGGPIPHSGSIPSEGDLRAPGATRLRNMQGRFVTGGFGWEWRNLTQLFQMPDAFAAGLEEAIATHMEDLRDRIEAHAKANAPWADRSGDAREGLKAVYIKRGAGVHEIDLGHSVQYGVYLENANGAAFAIVIPTLREFQGEMMNIQAGFDTATLSRSSVGGL